MTASPDVSVVQVAHPKLGTIVLLGAMAGVGALAIDLYLPGLPAIGIALHASPAAVANTVSAYLIGMAVGQLVQGPLSDRIGRRPVLLGGFAIAAVASLSCALAPGIGWLTVGRVAQAFGGSTGMVIGRAVVRDRYSHQDSARIFSFITLVFGVVPMVAPVIGAWLIGWSSWRAIFWTLAGFAATIGTATFFLLDESRSEATATKARGESVAASFVDLLGQRRLLGYVLASALNGAVAFTYIAAAPDLIITGFGFTPHQFALVFAANAVGIIGASQINRLLLDHYSADRLLGASSLVSVVAAGILLGAALSHAGPWTLLPLLFVVLASYGFMQSNAGAGALSVDPTRAGSTSALMGAAAFSVGAAAAALSGVLHNGTAVPITAVIFVALAGAAACLFGLALPRPGERSDA